MFDFDLPVIQGYENLPANLKKHYTRVTQNLVNCPIRFISRNRLNGLLAKSPNEFNGKWTRFEKEAANYYESLNLRVIKLEHADTQHIGRKENLFSGAAKLGQFLRQHWNAPDYERFIYRPDPNRQPTVLNGTDPKDYLVSYYPPDFLFMDMKNNASWGFSEVKGPNDSLSFRQANWFVNLIPKEWYFELCATIDNLDREVYFIPDAGERAAEGFAEAYERVMMEVKNYRDLMEKIKSAPKRKK